MDKAQNVDTDKVFYPLDELLKLQQEIIEIKTDERKNKNENSKI